MLNVNPEILYACSSLIVFLSCYIVIRDAV